MRSFRAIVILSALSVALAGCTATDSGVVDDIETQAVKGGDGASGGAVKNSAPSVRAWSADRTSGDNSGSFVVVFTGEVFDRNTENQVETLTVRGTGPATLGGAHAVTSDETKAAAAPASFGSDGFKVWTDTKNDGSLSFQFRQTFPAFTPAGSYAFTVAVTDKSGANGTSSPVTITLGKFALVTVSGAPVDASGKALSGQNWGQWSAEGGSANVPSTNYIKLINDGDSPNPTLVLDFTETGFVGSEDANFTVPIDGNLQFAWWEDTTPGTSAPSEGTFNFGDTSGTGSVQLRFTGKGNIIYVTYRVLQLPDVLPIQSYGASFTVTELA